MTPVKPSIILRPLLEDYYAARFRAELVAERRAAAVRVATGVAGVAGVLALVFFA